MNKFDIDLYLWYEPASIWLLIPSYSSLLRWDLKLTQKELLACDVGLDFRIDDVLYLGNERDALSLDETIFDLYNTTLKVYSDNEVIANLHVNDKLHYECKLVSTEKISLSRINTNTTHSYTDRAAHFVGSYYRDVEIDRDLWCRAVERAIDGLAHILVRSIVSPQALDNRLFQWLLKRTNDREH